MEAKNTIAIGSIIEATRPTDSFYSRVRGVVTAIKNERVKLDAFEVVSKFSTEWEKHPTSCAITVSVTDILKVS